VSLLVAAGCAVAAGVAGAFTPTVVRRLPEPQPPEDEGAEAGAAADQPDVVDRRPRRPIPDFSLWGLHAIEREKEPYRDLARVPGLALGCALASALVAGGLGWKLGWHPVLAVVIPPVPVCVAIAVLDWRTRYIPTWLVRPATIYVLAAAVVLWLTLGARDELVAGLVGMVVVRSALWLAWFLRAAAMGFGDVRLSALTGFVLAYLGYAEWVVGSFAGLTVMSIPIIGLALVHRDYQLLRVPFPLGPFLLIGALIGIFLGQPLMDAWAG
jgi:leader peptidase (prepilin peptidase)/N-methyltransferase